MSKRELRKPTVEQRQMAEFIMHGDIKETRVEGVNPVVFTNYNGNLGTFVPTEFLNGIVAALAQHSPLFDEENVTFIRTDHSRPLQAPWISDIENVASVITEGSSDSQQDIRSIAGSFIQPFSYRTPIIACSVESEQDVPQWADLFEFVLSDRLARGAGNDLIVGNGVGKPLGLIPTIQALAATIVAGGSNVNDGSGSTGTNSIGVQDLANLYFKVPHPYRKSPKFAFMMNSQTMLTISKLLDKSGRPLLDQQHDQFKLYNRPVLIDESMANISASAVPILAGDFSRWATRVCLNSMYMKRYTQAPGLIENGLIGLRLFARVGGVLMHTDPNAPSPIWGLQNHS